MEVNPLVLKLLILLLFLTALKIIINVLGNLENKLIKDIRKNRLRYGNIISRKDIAAFKTEIKIRNLLLYRIAFSNSFLMRIIPYNSVYDDTSAREQDEFLHWCSRLLTDMGYDNIDYSCKSTRGCTDLTCTKDGKTVYVQCILLAQDTESKDKNEDAWPKLERPDVQVLAGTMLEDNIYDGIIITTGDFTTSALEYANSLPGLYSLRLIDGYEITGMVRKLREQLL